MKRKENELYFNLGEAMHGEEKLKSNFKIYFSVERERERNCLMHGFVRDWAVNVNKLLCF